MSSLDAVKAIKDEGNARFMAKEYEAAIGHYARAIKQLASDEGSSSADGAPELLSILHSNTAQCHIFQGEWNLARKSAKTAVKFDGNNTEAQMRLETAEAKLMEKLSGIESWRIVRESRENTRKAKSKEQRGEMSFSEQNADWCGTWRQRNTNTVGIMLAEGNLLVFLLTHYDLIVYLGFSLWRKMIHHWVPKTQLANLRLKNQAQTSGLGYLPRISATLPAQYTRVRKPVNFPKSNEFYYCGFETELRHAITSNQVDVVMILFDEFQMKLTCSWSSNSHRSDPNLISEVAMRGDTQMLSHMLSSKQAALMSVEAQSEMLHCAADEDTISSLRVILTHPAIQKTKEELINVGGDGGPPLLTAVLCGSLEMLSLLLTHGADPNGTGDRTHTPLTWAAEGRCDPEVLDVVRFLVKEGGADPNVRIASDETSLQIAAREGSVEMVKLLLELGAHVNGGPRSDRAAWTTPLHDAAKSDSAEVVEILIEHGADIEAVDGNGLSARDCAPTSSRTRELLDQQLRHD